MGKDVVKRILTDGYEIISSGMFLLYEDKAEMEIEIGDFKFCLIFVFAEEPTTGSNLLLTNNGDNIMTLKCVNFEDLGTGTTNPIKIAVIEGKETFISFTAEKTTPMCRKVSYSISQRRENQYEK